MGTSNLLGFNETLIVFAGEHAEVLQKAGWSRADVQRFLMERTAPLGGRLQARRAPARRGRPPATRPRGATASSSPDDILIVCAGGRAGSWSACLPGWGNKWTRSVTTRIEMP